MSEYYDLHSSGENMLHYIFATHLYIHKLNVHLRCIMCYHNTAVSPTPTDAQEGKKIE